MKLKICYFANAESIHTIRWCKHFSSLGHEVHLISFKNASIENVKVHYVDAGKINVNGGNWRVLLKYRIVKAILKNIKPDIFHAQYATSYGITGTLCNYHPFVISAWGSDVLISPFHSRFVKLLLKYAFSQADRITVVADHMRDVLTKLNVDVRKVITISHGIDSSLFNAETKKMPEDKFVITCTRSFEQVYNIFYLLEAFIEAQKNYSDMHLNLVGSGTLQKEIESFIEKKGIKKNVTLYGRVSQPEIVSILNRSHVFVTVALSDGDVVSLVEAMACNNFCIVSDIPANNYWIEHNENGFIIPLHNSVKFAQAIIETYRNYDDLITKAIPLNRKIIEERGTWNKNMKIAEAMYVKLVNENKNKH
jgi:glycosyltransferase involved in cell wall biosynthesis